MKYKELEEIFNIVKMISGSKNRDKALNMILQTKTSELQSYEKLNLDKEEQFDQTMLLKFTDKEISRIPMRFRKDMIIDGRLVRCRKRKSGRKTFNYMLRYRRNGFDVCATSNDLDEAKQKFIEALQQAEENHQKQKETPVQNTVPTNFHDFTMYYYENFRRRKVSAKTLENDGYRYRNHLKPEFGEMDLKDITSAQCQQFLDRYEQKGQTKTNTELYSMLNGIFKMAIAHNIITMNPLAIVIQANHKCKHGKALTKEEEKLLLEKSADTKYQTIFAVMLYTGLRPNELYTVEIQKDFIKAKNSKRKGGKIEYKKIPISKMLRRYLKGVEKLEVPTLEYVRYNFNDILPNHILYDLRTTFYTRCEECGVAEPARDHYVGHSRGELNSTYSDLSDEYLLREGKKLVW